VLFRPDFDEAEELEDKFGILLIEALDELLKECSNEEKGFADDSIMTKI
jgi:hypothetical protein